MHISYMRNMYGVHVRKYTYVIIISKTTIKIILVRRNYSKIS